MWGGVYVYYVYCAAGGHDGRICTYTTNAKGGGVVTASTDARSDEEDVLQDRGCDHRENSTAVVWLYYIYIYMRLAAAGVSHYGYIKSKKPRGNGARCRERIVGPTVGGCRGGREGGLRRHSTTAVGGWEV